MDCSTKRVTQSSNNSHFFAWGDKAFGEKASYDRLGRYRITPEFQGVDLAYIDEKDWVHFYRENTQSIRLC